MLNPSFARHAARRAALFALAAVLACVALPTTTAAGGAPEEPVSLLDAASKTGGWSFNLGPEFPGATGQLVVEAEGGPEGVPCLRMDGDFTAGGGYVAAYVETPALEPDSVDFLLKTTGSPTAIIRVEDSSGQVHQIRYRLDDSRDWQRVHFPIHDFFAHMGTSRAIPGIANYERWNGAADGKWRGPIKRVGILLSKRHLGQGNSTGSLFLAAPVIVPRVERPTLTVTRSVSLMTLSADSTGSWVYDPGAEFKGAAGSLTPTADGAAQPAFLRLAGDFTGGGKYVQALSATPLPPESTVTALRLQLRSTNVTTYALRLIDGSGQVHQKRHNPFEPNGEWQAIHIDPAAFAGGEHWGGANDGAWHGGLQKIAIMINERSDPTAKQPVLDIAGVELDASVVVEAARPSLSQGFEAGADLPAGWTATPGVTISAEGAAAGKQALLLTRSEASMDDAVNATSASFPSAPGTWEFSLQARADLISPDGSFAGTVKVQFLDHAENVLGSSELLHVYGKQDAWQATQRSVDAPAGSVAARLQIGLNKAIGRFWLDDLSATRIVGDAFAVKKIDRVLFGTEAMGNLLLPEQPVVLSAEVYASQPLSPAERAVAFVLRDYWSVEQGPPLLATLQPDGRADGLLKYRTQVDLTPLQPALYQYYEVQIQIPQTGQAPFTDYTSFARLPEAVTHQYAPEQIPFTSRNWDNRVREYFYLSHRIGIRTISLWGSWDATPPYEPKAPGIDLVQELGMAGISRTPIVSIEGHRPGWEAYTPEVLREGTKRFLDAFLPQGLALITLGNEPRGDAARVAEQIAAYKVVYEAVKAYDPAIPVIGSSMGPEEAYFAAGQGKYLDAYDFHTYQPYSHLDGIFARYDALFAKYGDRKPIWCTEIGLNSQGMTRYDVAKDMMKKLPYFFAKGGANVSWFGIVYPDPDGRSRGSSGDSFNVFDSRYKRYSPRLDGVMYYTLVNTICVKTFQAEKRYDGELRAFHFRDAAGENMQLWFGEKASREVFIPLPGVQEVTLVRIDSSRATLRADGEGVTMRVGDEGFLLLYRDPEGMITGLPEALGTPALRLQGEPPTAAPGADLTLTFARDANRKVEPSMRLPAGWTGTLETTDTAVAVRLQVPAATQARSLQLRLACGGEVTVPITITPADTP